MPYRYLDDIATADTAFEAWGRTDEELFVAAADATMNVMVEDLETIAARERRRIEVESDALDMLLFRLLQELIYHKDADRLLLRVPAVRIERRGGLFHLASDAHGEEIDPGKHPLNADVKAVTLHRFRVEMTPEGWRAVVVLDI